MLPLPNTDRPYLPESMMDVIRRFIGNILPRGALLLSALTFAGYAMGLVRDRAFARTFGADSSLDAYNAALQLPEITLNILVAAGLGAAFVPVFARMHGVDVAVADRFSRTVLTVGTIVMGIGAIVLFVLAPLTADLIVPGYTGAEREEYIELFRVMCGTTVIFAISFTIGEMLVARQRFLAYGIAPLLYNTGIVLGVVVLGPRMGIMGAAIGTVVGSLLHLGVRLIGVRRTDASLRPALFFRTREYREYLRLSIPRMVAEPIESLTFTWFTRVATTIVVGGVSAVSFARNFQSVPVSLVGVAFSIAAFPVLSAAAGAGDRPRFVRIVTTNLVTITVITTVGALLMYLLSGRIIDVFLRGDAFDAQDAALTAAVLGAFTLSIPLEALTHLLARAVYATRNTLLPVIASLVGLVVTLVTVEMLKDSQGLVALPLAFAAGQGVKAALLGAILVLRIGGMGDAGHAGQGDGVPAGGPLPDLEETRPNAIG